MTKRQLSRHQRDKRLQRITKIGFGVLFVVIVLVVAFGYWRVNVQPGTEAILRVRGVDISTQTFARVLGYRQFAVDQQIARLQSFAASQQGSSGQGNDSAALVQQYVQQQVQQLSQQRASLESNVMDEMIGDQFIMQEAAKRGINVSAAEIDAEIYRQYLPSSQTNDVSSEQNAAVPPAPESTPQPTAVPTMTPAPTPTPMTQEEALADVSKQLGTLGLMSESEYRELIIKPQMLRERLQTAMAADVPTTQDQVWARHILVDNEDTAKDVIAKLEGGSDFAELAKDLSTDTSNKEKGGDLGWFLRGTMVPEFESAAFSLQVGQTVNVPVKTSFGYHVIQLLGHDPNRALTDDQLQKAKDNVVGDWIKRQRDDDPKAVEYGYSWDRVKWARDWIDKNAKYLRQTNR